MERYNYATSFTHKLARVIIIIIGCYARRETSRGVAFDMRISSMHFPKPTTGDGGGVALALATFCGAHTFTFPPWLGPISR